MSPTSKPPPKPEPTTPYVSPLKPSFLIGSATLTTSLKGRGFNLDDTRLWNPERLNRLIFAAAIAYFLMITLGVVAIMSGAIRQLVRTDAFYHSLFQLGLIYLDHILNELLNFPSLIDLPPPDTFEHIVIRF